MAIRLSLSLSIIVVVLVFFLLSSIVQNVGDSVLEPGEIGKKYQEKDKEISIENFNNWKKMTPRDREISRGEIIKQRFSMHPEAVFTSSFLSISQPYTAELDFFVTSDHEIQDFVKEFVTRCVDNAVYLAKFLKKFVLDAFGKSDSDKKLGDSL
ncbi:hypothetical protein MIDIC_490008 [Alphaproteobacteria bacterium]